jgi:hypothetical protein
MPDKPNVSAKKPAGPAKKPKGPVKKPELLCGVSTGNSQANTPKGPYDGVSYGNSGVKKPEVF